MFVTRSLDQFLISLFISPRAHWGFVVILSDTAPVQPREQSFNIGSFCSGSGAPWQAGTAERAKVISPVPAPGPLGLPGGFSSAADLDGMLYPGPGTALRNSCCWCAPRALPSSGNRNSL